MVKELTIRSISFSTNAKYLASLHNGGGVAMSVGAAARGSKGVDSVALDEEVS